MLNVFIGYDKRESVAYHVLSHSILRRASVPVTITPIALHHLPYYTREKKAQSTDFTFSRFLVPYMSGFVGQALFMDCDMLVRCDIKELFDKSSYNCDVHLVKHDYQTKEGEKFLGNRQVHYPRKNWSSLMLFNCWTSPCKHLLPDVVNKQTPQYLHRFEWTQDSRIVGLDKTWNHLVGDYEYDKDAKIVHFTYGTPCFPGYEKQDYADEWFAEFEDMAHAGA
jgi:hypothetical protein